MPTFTQLASQGNTIIEQGRFTSLGTPVTLAIPSGFSWIRVLNETAAYSAVAGDLGFDFYFQVGMTVGRGVVWTKLGTGTDAAQRLTVGQIAANAGFVPFSSGLTTLTAPVAITAGTNATRPVYSTANTAGLVTGSIVRLYSLTGQLDMTGYDWSIDTVVANTSFRIAPVLANAPGAAATAGNYRIVTLNPLYYPPVRFICNAVSAGATTVLTLTIPSGYQVGQEIRVYMPSAFGMTQIDQLTGTILAVNDAVGTQSITLNIDSSAFNAFTWPTGAGTSTKAMVVPVGIDTATALGLSPQANVLVDSVTNNGYIGVTLGAGAAAPAGQNGDVISWVAGTSYSNIQMTLP